MKIVLISVCLVFIFSGMQIKRKNIYGISSSPIQDTLVAGIDNELQVLKNGKACVNFDGVISLRGGNLRSAGDGKYTALVEQSKSAKAVVLLYVKGKDVFEKTFIIRAKKENE